jgi:hypothetical protein
VDPYQAADPRASEGSSDEVSLDRLSLIGMVTITEVPGFSGRILSFPSVRSRIPTNPTPRSTPFS